MKFIFNGECHLLFLMNSKRLQDEISKYGEIVNNCIGSWLIDQSIESMLGFNLFNIEDGDIFVLGFANSIDSDESGERERKFLESIKRIEYVYPNSKIIFVSFPVRSDDKSYDQVLEKVTLRDRVLNNKNKFHFKVLANDDEYRDSGHLIWEKYESSGFELGEYISRHIGLLKTPRVEKIAVKDIMEFSSNKYVEVAFMLDVEKYGPLEDIVSKFKSGKSEVLKEMKGNGFREWNQRVHVMHISDLRYIAFDKRLKILSCLKVNY